MASNFRLLQDQWPAIHEASTKAEAAVHGDPRTACFYVRRALELTVAWLYKHDPALKLPYQDNLSALIHDPTFKQTAGEAEFSNSAAKGQGNTDPRRAYRQQAAVELTSQGADWLTTQLETAFARHGRIAPTQLAGLDWPKVPKTWKEARR